MQLVLAVRVGEGQVDRVLEPLEVLERLLLQLGKLGLAGSLVGGPLNPARARGQGRLVGEPGGLAAIGLQDSGDPRRAARTVARLGSGFTGSGMVVSRSRR